MDLINKLASDSEGLSPEKIVEIEEKLRVGCGHFVDWRWTSLERSVEDLQRLEPVLVSVLGAGDD
eukprot:10527060-Prorocentrum_lima.AAC.1